MGKLKKLFSLNFYKFEFKTYKEYISDDYKFNASFENKKICNLDKKSINIKYLRTYRKYQANRLNIWGYLYKQRLNHISKRTGIDFEGNTNFGHGLIIGHWGRIVVNGDTQFGNEIFLTHNVTIGRDIRGKRAGVPTIGNRVCVRTNSTIVGKISIGDDVLIAPNTFVNFDVPSHSVVIGNPATIHSKENATEGHLGLL